MSNLVSFAISVDEEQLLPGAQTSRDSAGDLSTLLQDKIGTLVYFKPITEQAYLTSTELMSNGMPLFYTLDENNQHLKATAGEHGPDVFTARIDNHGHYIFTLYDHIDRPAPANLVANIDLQLPQNKIEIVSTGSDSYKLSCHFHPIQNAPSFEAIQIYWDNKLLHTIDATQQISKNYIFSVEGTPLDSHTSLQIVGVGGHPLAKLADYIDNVTVNNLVQNKLPLDFAFTILDSSSHATEGSFTVNVNTTPHIALYNKEAYDIYYEQGVYQSIVVYDHNQGHNPMTTINLDSLFKNLSIPIEDRLVQVVQLEENGQGTHFYEVKISDKHQSIEPITVADVHLSFPGGNGGLSVFDNNIQIHTDHTATLMPLDTPDLLA